MNTLLPNTDLNWESRENQQTIQVWHKSNPLQLYIGNEKYIQGIESGRQSAKELWMEIHDTVQEAGIKTIPKKRNAKKQNGCLKRPYK